MVKPLLPLLAALLLGACSSFGQLDKWDTAPALGMTESEVTRLAGTPDRIEPQNNDVQAWVYDYDVVSLGLGLTKGKTREVLFKDGRVVGHRVSNGTTTTRNSAAPAP